LLLPITLALAVAACADDDATAPTTSRPPATATTTTTSAVEPAAPRPLAVTRQELVVEDTSRPTAAAANRGLAASPSRTLPLLVLVPEGDGPFPIVGFAHGVSGSGPAYEPFLRRIAEAGYVVVAPTFPLSSGGDGEIFDYVNQPGDVYFAVDAVAAELGDRVDGERVALAGHSLGAMTTFGAAYNSCCTQPRVDAAVLLAGVEAPFPGGDDTDRPGIPLLLVHGDLDTTIVSSSSDDLFAAATGPVAFLRLPQADHNSIFVDEAGDVVSRTIVAWLDRWLLDEPAALDDLPTVVEAGGIATLATSGL
jgi:dienelactone hydrolase